MTHRGTTDSQHWPMLALVLAALWLLMPLQPAVAQDNAAAADEPVPIERQPYRIRVGLSFARDAMLTGEFRETVEREFVRLIERSYGQMWQATIAQEPTISPAGPAGLGRFTEESIRNRFDAEYDKAYFVTVDLFGPRYQLAARVWDRTGRTLSSIERASTYERRDVAGSAYELIDRLFEPVFTVDDATADTAQLRLQAGEFPAPDPEAAQLREGDFIVPFFRYLDRDREVRQIQFVPWTYLLVTSRDRGRVGCDIISGLRAPLGTGRMRLVEIMGAGRHPNYSGTDLQLLTQQEPPVPVVAVEVEVIPKTLRTDEAAGEPVKLISDRSGIVRVPVVPDQPIVWIYVHSGESLLARVPFVPGLEQSSSFRLPDDSARLQAEGQIELLKARLIDTLARRSAITARIRRLARENDWTEVEKLVKQLDALPGVDVFEGELAAIRIPAIEHAKENTDRVAESRIRKLSSDASSLIHRFLNPEPIRLLKEEVAELRAIAAEEN